MEKVFQIKHFFIRKSFNVCESGPSLTRGSLQIKLLELIVIKCSLKESFFKWFAKDKQMFSTKSCIFFSKIHSLFKIWLFKIWFLTKNFQITHLLVNPKKLLIASFSIYPCCFVTLDDYNRETLRILLSDHSINRTTLSSS